MGAAIQYQSYHEQSFQCMARGVWTMSSKTDVSQETRISIYEVHAGNGTEIWVSFSYHQSKLHKIDIRNHVFNYIIILFRQY